ncbi:MAG: hypothetical protein ACOYKZ_03355 [Chlamydiia bacterium]
MSRLVRWIVWIVVLILLLLVLGFLGRRPIAEFMLGHSLHTSVSMSVLDLSPKNVLFENLYIASPTGSRMATALMVRSGEVEAQSFSHFFGNPLELNRVELHGVRIGFDFPKGPSMTEGNWATLLASDKASPPRDIRIHELVLKDVEVSMIGMSGVVTTMPPIAEIRLANVSTAEGIKSHQLVGLVLQAIFTNIVTMNGLIPGLQVIGTPLGAGIGKSAELLQDTGGHIKSGLQSIFQSSEAPASTATPSP